MSNAIEALKAEIQKNAYEIHELSQVIKTLKTLIREEPDNEDHKVLADETLERYKKILRKTQIQLEAYMAEETKAGLPADMVYRKLYNKIKKVI